MGREDKGSGFALGRAADGDQPGGRGASVPAAAYSGSAVPARAEVKEPPTPIVPAKGGAEDNLALLSSDKERAFRVYKAGAGAERNDLLATLRGELRELRGRLRSAASAVNGAKAEIDKLSAGVAERKAQRERYGAATGPHADGGKEDVLVLEEAEYLMMKRLSAAKRAYRDAFADLEGLRSDVQRADDEADAQKALLLAEFDAWLARALAGPATAATGGADMADLDDGEKFQAMEEKRVIDSNPEALAFFQAQKVQRAARTQNAVRLRQLRANKRNL